jgi:hypothetical protein
VRVLQSKRGSKAAATALVLAVTSTATAAANEGEARAIRAFRAEADTYVSAAEPHRNFGRARALEADGEPQAIVYLRFRIKKEKRAIDGVTLLLHANGGARTSYQVRRVKAAEWRERRLTYSSAPRLSLRYTSSKPVHRGAWSAVDVTPIVEEDDDVVSLAITTKSPLGVVFASRESNRGPRLVLRTAAGSVGDAAFVVTS